jgi:hypothetical protein
VIRSDVGIGPTTSSIGPDSGSFRIERRRAALCFIRIAPTGDAAHAEHYGGDGSGFPRVSRKLSDEGLYTVPRLEELAADPGKAGVLDARTARIIAAKAVGVFGVSLYRLFEAVDESDSDNEPRVTPAERDGPPSSSRTLPGLDDVASVEEVAGIIGKPRRWIIQNAANLPFVTRVSRKHYVCSRIVLRRWLASRPRALKGQ